jgi:hypothetical protein
MDEAARIPIDISYEAASTEATSARSIFQRSAGPGDGKVVIDILVPEPCPAEPSTGDEIVVCAQVGGDSQGIIHAPEPAPYDEPRGVPKAELSLGPNARLAVRGETDGASGGQRVMIDFKLKF